MEWIFDNLFIILLALSGIFGFFGKKDEDDKKKTNQPKQKPIPRPTPTPSGRYQRSERSVGPKEAKQPTVTISMEEQKQEQLERLAEKLRTKTANGLDDISRKSINDSSVFDNEAIKTSKKKISDDQVKLKKQIGSNLTKKGLIQGIIMSEVLGPPRATKPYRSVIEERQIK